MMDDGWWMMDNGCMMKITSAGFLTFSCWK